MRIEHGGGCWDRSGCGWNIGNINGGQVDEGFHIAGCKK